MFPTLKYQFHHKVQNGIILISLSNSNEAKMCAKEKCVSLSLNQLADEFFASGALTKTRLDISDCNDFNEYLDDACAGNTVIIYN